MSNFHYKTLRVGSRGGVDVLGWGTYPRHSVLAGQPSKSFIDNYVDEAAARAAHPDARGFSNVFTEPQVCLSHLPSEDDPVPGGMYPDDIDDRRTADHIDGYDRDDLGESPDY